MTTENKTTIPWIEKYRPKTLTEILSHDNIVSTIRTFINNKCLPHLLFYGGPGLGKSSMIIATAKELYGKHFPYMVMELNASDDRGIEVVRNKIKQFVKSKNVFISDTKDESYQDKFKLVILDEADAMTNDAQAILRKIVEEYTRNTRFCLICNNIQNISPALKSRCTIFRFSPIGPDKIKEKIMDISKKEDLNITEDAIKTLITRSNGDMRKMINMLQSVSMSYKLINDENVDICLGYPGKNIIVDIIENLLTKSFMESYNKIIKIINTYGYSIGDIINEIHNIFVSYTLNSKTQIKIINTIDQNTIINILDKLATIEFNQSVNIIDNIQISGLISIFKLYSNKKLI